VVEKAESEGRPIYGLTRGLGRRVVHDLPREDAALYSRAVILARAGGAGAPLPQDAVRAALLARAASFARGGAGVRPVLAETQAAMLNRGVHPVVPSIGSVGASDLALLANLALPIIGEGRAWHEDKLLPGGEAMARAGIKTLTLLSKEGLALCSANSVAAGYGALVLHDTEALLRVLEAAVVLTYEAFRGNPSPLDARVAAARPAPGQAETAKVLRRLLAGSALLEPGGPRRVQDPISLRCVSQVHGALRTAIEWARAPVMAELNGAGDNPLVLADDDEILSNGNFHTPALAIAFDALAIALSQCATMAAMRVARMMTERLTDLPDTLTTLDPVSRTGVAALSFTAATLSKEIRRLAQPASLDDAGGYEVEDHTPMTPVAVRKCATILEHLTQIAACELIASAQALELRGDVRPNATARAAFDAVRSVSPKVVEDRALVLDVEAVTALIGSGALARALPPMDAS
jgi:histidine ammonia-lyase